MAAGNAIRRYKATEFAELSGVTVRALHHYDRLGLLRPKRTHNGYRAYGEQELVRLEQIVALKFSCPAPCTCSAECWRPSAACWIRPSKRFGRPKRRPRRASGRTPRF